MIYIYICVDVYIYYFSSLRKAGALFFFARMMEKCFFSAENDGETCFPFTDYWETGFSLPVKEEKLFPFNTVMGVLLVSLSDGINIGSQLHNNASVLFPSPTMGTSDSLPHYLCSFESAQKHHEFSLQ